MKSIYDVFKFEEHGISRSAYNLIKAGLILVGVIVAMAMIYKTGLDNGAENATAAISQWNQEYNVYLVEKEAIDGRQYQMGPGKGPIYTDNGYVQYEYEDGNLVFTFHAK